METDARAGVVLKKLHQVAAHSPSLCTRRRFHRRFTTPNLRSFGYHLKHLFYSRCSTLHCWLCPEHGLISNPIGTLDLMQMANVVLSASTSAFSPYISDAGGEVGDSFSRPAPIGVPAPFPRGFGVSM